MHDPKSLSRLPDDAGTLAILRAQGDIPMRAEPRQRPLTEQARHR